MADSDANLEVRALDLLEQAMDQPSEGREAWIEAQPQAPAVRDRARTMLAGRTGAAHALPTGGGPVHAGEAPLPTQIGAYRVTGRIGQGGMGAVYRGERAADDFDHSVAIKVIRPGALSKSLVDRFRRERRTLARLSHPHIARLFDGGETELGEPYIVMELVDGAPLGEWVQEAPPISNRIRLFLQVCEAVGFAHQNLIVHRDLTPANILVQRDGVPKLIDFGIARPMTEETGAPEGAAMSVTPAFAAPERLRGEAATTQSDIYSLGRLLETLFPSTESADLRAIIARSTAATPADRYATVEALAGDVAAWRDHRPVAARGGGSHYVLSRFVRRHRTAVSAGAAALLLLFGAFGLATWSYLRADAARRVEAERFAQVRALANYMIFDLNPRLAQTVGNTAARAAIAEEAQTYLDRLVATPNPSAALRLETARGLIQLARVQAAPGEPNLGAVGPALANLDTADRLLANLPPGPTRDVEQSLSRAHRGLILLRAVGRQAEAEPLILSADRWVSAVPESARGRRWTEARRVTRKARLELADVSDRRDQIPSLADALLADIERWPQDLRASTAPALDAAFATYYRALHAQTRDLPGALTLHLDAERRLDALLAARPNDPTLLNLASWNALDGFAAGSRLGREDVSHRLIEKADVVARRLLTVDERDQAARRLALNIREALAQDLRDRDLFDEAVALQAEVVAGRRSQARLEPNSRTVGGVGFSLAIQGIIAKNAGDRALACASWREAEVVLAKQDAEGGILGFHKSFLPGLRRAVALCRNGAPLSRVPPLRS